jgi:hypothetical protein
MYVLVTQQFAVSAQVIFFLWLTLSVVDPGVRAV